MAFILSVTLSLLNLSRCGRELCGNPLSKWLYILQKSLSLICGYRDLFREQNRLGSSLKINACPREPRHCTAYFDVRAPSDFAKILPCQAQCGHRLPCGHICSERWLLSLSLPLALQADSLTDATHLSSMGCVT
jgi:hypothetical protein